MYVHPAFKTSDEAAWKFVQERGFGAVVAVDAGKPVASHVPLMTMGDLQSRRVQFHVARVNPLHEIIARTPEVLVTVWGPDAYISPDWYVSPDQVPTWNYVSVHLSGAARTLALDEALQHVEELSLRFESWLAPKKPWSTAKMPARKLEAMLKAIVPIEIAVDKIEASWKLGQHKTTADQYEVARMLDWRGDWNGRAMAQVMKERFAALAAADATQAPANAA